MELYRKPVYLKKKGIFEIFYANGSLNILASFERNQKKITIDKKEGKVFRCRHRFTEVHKFNIKECDTVTFKLNGEDITTHVNKYPDFKDEIIMGTLTKDQDAYIKMWIIYHKNLGVTKFVIYDNSERGTLKNVLREYIENGEVILLSWTYKYHKQHAQQLQQTHLVHAFRSCKYIGLLDIDEYVNPQKDLQCIPSLLKYILKEHKTEYSKISAISLQNRFFYNPSRLPDTNFNHLEIYNCSSKTSGRERKKMFVNPNNVFNVSVHTITNGKGNDLLTHHKYGYFNHYRYLGYFKDKNNSRLNGGKKKDKSIKKHTSFLKVLDNQLE